MTSDGSVTKQRLRIRFTRDETLKYIGHLDMARTWQRIVRRANLPLAYSEGFNPQPRMSFAAALPVGCTSDHEELDMVLSPPCAIDDVKTQLNRALPPGIKVVSIAEMPLNAPALQMLLNAAEFEITVEDEETIELWHERVSQFMAATEIMRDRRGKVYNLRPLVQTLALESAQADRDIIIRARLQANAEGTGRPDELAAALGLDPSIVKIKRTKLIFLDNNLPVTPHLPRHDEIAPARDDAPRNDDDRAFLDKTT
jgi:radical SAM-linked protein